MKNTCKLLLAQAITLVLFFIVIAVFG